VRVIAGTAGGRTLRAPRTRDTRPITDRVKESLFGILGGRVVDARVLDLYAGSGAIGIEALSRGADHCTFVERGREALAMLRQNLQETGLAHRATVVAGPVERFLAGEALVAFDLAMVDPPFAEHAILAPLEALVPLLAPGATVVVRTFWRTPVPTPAALAVVRDRRFGETMLTFLEKDAAGGPGKGEGDSQ
jgi:16S rRNA (guanine(966)-N(2))-methyltransferase RsmD